MAKKGKLERNGKRNRESKKSQGKDVQGRERISRNAVNKTVNLEGKRVQTLA